MYIPGVAVVLLSIWRSPVDRRELPRMLTDIYRVHPGTRLSGVSLWVSEERHE
jgi:hypothetical protein